MSNSHPDYSLGFQNISDLFSLEPQHLNEAQRLSQQYPHVHRQWHLYGQTLATLAFEEWLDYRAPSLTINTQENFIKQPEYANLIDAVVHLQVGSFKVCLLPNLCMSDPEILLPKAVVDIPELSAHLYVVVGIDEESELAGVQGFLRFDQINTLCKKNIADQQHNYTVLIAEFNANTNELLLNLDVLDTSMILLPEIPVIRKIALDNIRADLEALLSKHQRNLLDYPFSWRQLEAILTNSELRKWIYQYHSKKNNSPSLKNPIPETIINIRNWLDGEIVNLKNGLRWSYLNSPRTEMRLNSDISLIDIINEIEKSKELNIPSTAKLTYQDIPCSSFTEDELNYKKDESQREYSEITDIPNIRLYGVTWFSELEQTWSLLLIMGSFPNQAPPYGVNFLVSQNSEILLNEQLKQPDAYLYIQLIGEVNEIFTVVIAPALADIDIKYSFTFSSQ